MLRGRLRLRRRRGGAGAAPRPRGRVRPDALSRTGLLDYRDKEMLAFSGSRGCRGEPSLSPSDAQRNVAPEKYNGSQHN
eukprot:11353250-Heterocapsa_arctica.AAC.1